MKKFLALLFVCAGLTAMAGVPKLNNAPLSQSKAKSMIMKGQQASLMTEGSKAMTVQKFFTEKNVTPNDNKLLNKAPRRVAEEDILGSKIVFMEAYSYNEDSAAVVADNIFYYGGWTSALSSVGSGAYEVDLYFDGIPFTINVDLAAKTAALVMNDLGEHYMGKDTTSTGGTRPTYTVNEYNAHFYLVDEETMTHENNTVDGSIFEDGSIYFANGWGVYVDMTITTTTYNKNWEQTNQTTQNQQGMYTPFFRSTYLMTPSATHSYVDTYDNTSDEVPVYMYQYDDTTAVVWNIYGIGNRGNYMYIYEDGTMHFPNGQYGGDMASQREYCEANYSTYDWTDADHVTLMAYSESTGKPDGSVAYTEGTVDSEKITWPYMSLTWWGYDATNQGWVYLYVPPYSNNVLKFTNGDKFLFGTVEEPTIQVEAGDEAYVFTGVSEEGATVYLALYDPETSQLTELVDNPYEVVRTNEEQVVYLSAYADGFEIGKNDSGWIGFEPFVVPALESTLKIGDVNNDGFINVADVTALISHVLTQDFNDSETFNSENADINQDGGWNVADVTALINLVLNQ